MTTTKIPAKVHNDQRFGRAVIEAPTPPRISAAERWQAANRARKFARAMDRAERKTAFVRTVERAIEALVAPIFNPVSVGREVRL